MGLCKTLVRWSNVYHPSSTCVDSLEYVFSQQHLYLLPQRLERFPQEEVLQSDRCYKGKETSNHRFPSLRSYLRGENRSSTSFDYTDQYFGQDPHHLKLHINLRDS